MEFIEAPLFSKYVYEYFSEEEYRALQWSLLHHPEAGDLIPGSGGLRKIRWSLKAQGKRGGTRIIYYYKSHAGQIWLLTVYAKNEIENIAPGILKKIKEELVT
jgi:mRNA-degrading endonuclease RelE of RelBE toxin-antitoxin system